MLDCSGLYSVKKLHQQEEKEEGEQHRERSQEGDKRKINLVYFREYKDKQYLAQNTAKNTQKQSKKKKKMINLTDCFQLLQKKKTFAIPHVCVGKCTHWD